MLSERWWCNFNLNLTSMLGNNLVVTALSLTAVCAVIQSHSAEMTLSHEWLHAHTYHTHKRTCHLLTWTGHIPLGVTDLGKRSNLSSSLSCFTPAPSASFSSELYEELKGRTSDGSSSVSVIFFPPAAIGLLLFLMATWMADVELNRDKRRGGGQSRWIARWWA